MASDDEDRRGSDSQRAAADHPVPVTHDECNGMCSCCLFHPTAPVIRRPGQISAWENEDFVAPVKLTGKNRIMAGEQWKVCLPY